MRAVPLGEIISTHSSSRGGEGLARFTIVLADAVEILRPGAPVAGSMKRIATLPSKLPTPPLRRGIGRG